MNYEARIYESSWGVWRTSQLPNGRAVRLLVVACSSRDEAERTKVALIQEVH